MRYMILGGLLALAMLAASCGSSASDEDQANVATPATAQPTTAASPTEAPEFETEPEPAPVAENDGLFPTIVSATAANGDGTTWRFDVTLLSEYDSPERYADAWRVLDENDVELGIRVLGHDHANEQPFTRSTSVDIPDDITTVFIEARDQLNGWNDERYEVTLSR